MHLTRRHFLMTSLAAIAAAGFKRSCVANTEANENLVDTRVYLGQWPHGDVGSEDAAALINDLRRNNITQAWVSSFEGLFHKDIAAVNQRLFDSCQTSNAANSRRPTVAGQPHPELIPFGTINPTLPDWEEDVRRCHEVFHMPGIRLHPNYHGYTLVDPRFAQLLGLAKARGLIVQLVASLNVKPHFLLSPSTAQVELEPLAQTLSTYRNLQLIVANCELNASLKLFQALAKSKQVSFDIGSATRAKDVIALISAVSPERILFGSGAPLHSPESIWAKVQEANLSRPAVRAIAHENASRLLNRGSKEDRR